MCDFHKIAGVSALVLVLLMGSAHGAMPVDIATYIGVSAEEYETACIEFIPPGRNYIFCARTTNENDRSVSPFFIGDAELLDLLNPVVHKSYIAAEVLDLFDKTIAEIALELFSTENYRGVLPSIKNNSVLLRGNGKDPIRIIKYGGPGAITKVIKFIKDIKNGKEIKRLEAALERVRQRSDDYLDFADELFDGTTCATLQKKARKICDEASDRVEELWNQLKNLRDGEF